MNVIEAAFPSENLIQKRNKLNSLIANHHEQGQWLVKLTLGEWQIFSFLVYLYLLGCIREGADHM